MIQRLSASLTRLLQERQEDGNTSSQLEVGPTLIRSCYYHLLQALLASCVTTALLLSSFIVKFKSSLQEDVTALREQVRLALTKASHNKEFKLKYQELRQEHDLQTEQVNALTEEMGNKESKLEEVEKVLQTKIEEISTFESAKLRLIEQLQSIQKMINISNSRINSHWILFKKHDEIILHRVYFSTFLSFLC